MSLFWLLALLSWIGTIASIIWTAICVRLDCYNGGALILSGFAIGTAIAAASVKWWQ